MKPIQICLCLLWLLAGAVCLSAARPIRLPVFCPCDTARIGQLHFSGAAAETERIAYWDSLLANADIRQCAFFRYSIAGKIADICSQRNDLPGAVRHNNEALAIAGAQGDKPAMIRIIRKLVRLAYLRLDRQQMLSLIYQGLTLAEELEDKRSAADFYSFIGLYYFSAREFGQALQVHLQCLKMCRAIGYDFGISSALVDIGSDYSNLGRHDLSAVYFLESRKYLGNLQGTIYAVQINNSIACAYQSRKQWDSAYYYSREALKIAKRIGSRIAVASTLDILAGADYQSGRNTAAKQKALQALALARSTGFMVEIPPLADLIRKICLREGNYREALKAYELYVRTNDSFSNERVRKQALEREYRYRLEKKDNDYTLLSQRSQIQRLKLSQQRWLTAGLIVLLAVILVIVLLVLRHRRFRADHQRVTLEQKLLCAQMNPHFLFNSMNAIQQLIMSGKNGPAERYLSRFSRLIRDLLESNTRESLTVREEADMLQAYLEMESLRFGNTFSYAIDIDTRVDAQRTAIPHLMIQPFVENAIWHGLLSRDGDRQLRIVISYHAEQTISCIVDDNGVGRAGSAGRDRMLPRKSLALDLVQQRIDLIQKTRRIAGSVEIIDKTDALGRSLGTTVALILPVLNPPEPC